MKERDCWFALQEAQDIGKKIVRKLQKEVQNLALIEQMDVGDLIKYEIPVDKARLLKDCFATSFISERYETYRKQGIEVIVKTDPHYPKLLKEISDPPWALYVKGDSRLLHHPSIAVVGARRATIYGTRVTRHLVSQICSYGFGIVSGMARGIDTEAHQASLRSGAPSIAVLGTGLDVCYPRENKMLIERMADEGAVVSENPLGAEVKKWLFAKRNRIISGLSLGTLVTEADENSGALQTADSAINQNREVFMVPGSIFSPQSRGIIKWLKYSGAHPVTCGDDIAEQFQNRFLFFDHTNNKNKDDSESGLSSDERHIMQYMTHDGVTIDELLAKTKFPFGHLHTVLLSLLIKKKILKQSGSTYSRIH